MRQDMSSVSACYSAGGLAINAGGAATVKTVNTVQIMFNGMMKAVAAASAIAFPSGLPIQPISSSWMYLVTVKFSDATKRIFGPTEYLSAAGANLGNAVPGATTAKAISQNMPRVPEGFVPIGVMRIVTDGVTTFTPGTTALDATGVTVTYTDLAGYPVYGGGI